MIVHTYSAGVFAGTLESKIGKEVILSDARRLWYWAGAASLSQLAVDGVSKPNKCKFPVVSRIELTEAGPGTGPGPGTIRVRVWIRVRVR